MISWPRRIQPWRCPPQLLPSTTVAVTPETHTFTLKISSTSTSAAPSTVTVTNAVITAIDLGRKP